MRRVYQSLSVVREAYSGFSAGSGYLSGYAAILIAVSTLVLPISARAIILIGTQQNIATATLRLDSQAATCSATLVGPKAVLTAATCLEGGGQAEVTASDGTKYQLFGCQFIPEFMNNRNFDLELCYSASPIPLVPERINTDPNSFQIGDTVYLAGLGCAESGGADTKFGMLTRLIRQKAPERLASVA
jgi:hypothetical protein